MADGTGHNHNRRPDAAATPTLGNDGSSLVRHPSSLAAAPVPCAPPPPPHTQTPPGISTGGGRGPRPPPGNSRASLRVRIILTSRAHPVRAQYGPVHVLHTSCQALPETRSRVRAPRASGARSFQRPGGALSPCSAHAPRARLPGACPVPVARHLGLMRRGFLQRPKLWHVRRMSWEGARGWCRASFEQGGGGGEGVLDPKLGVPKMA